MIFSLFIPNGNDVIHIEINGNIDTKSCISQYSKCSDNCPLQKPCNKSIQWLLFDILFVIFVALKLIIDILKYTSDKVASLFCSDRWFISSVQRQFTLSTFVMIHFISSRDNSRCQRFDDSFHQLKGWFTCWWFIPSYTTMNWMQIHTLLVAEGW